MGSVQRMKRQPVTGSRRLPATWLLVAVSVLAGVGVSGGAHAARPQSLDLRHLEIEIAGPPISVLPADLDGDGRLDLLVVTAFTFWGQITTDRTTERDGLLFEEVEVLPTLVDRREMQLWLAQADGTYRAAAAPQPLPFSVVALDLGPPSQAVLALTTAGVSVVRFDPSAPAEPLRIEPWIEDAPVLAGTQTLLPGYRFSADVDADGDSDLLLPARDGVAIYLAEGGRLSTQPVARVALPGDEGGKDGVVWRRYPLPTVQDVQGDGIPDLVFFHLEQGDARLVRGTERGFNAITVLQGSGGGRFGEPRVVSLETPANADQPTVDDSGKGRPEVSILSTSLPGSLSFFGDLDGDGIAELVTQDEIQREGQGLRVEMKNAKRPHYKYRFYRLRADMTIERTPYHQFQAEGYPFDFNWLDASPGGFADLDGDGRKDLVTVSLDFSLWQAPKILIAKSIGAGLDFHVWTQEAGGEFREVRQARMRGKLKIDLARMRMGQFAQFAGDFDGDGHIDFIHLGSERKVGIHRGRDGCHYPAKPDVSIRLASSPQDPGLVRVRDLDGDGRSDLMVVTPLKADGKGVTRPTRMEFYLTARGG